MMDSIESLVNEAHGIFKGTSIFEVLNSSREEASAYLKKKYDNPSQKSINRYLDVIGRLRELSTTKIYTA